MSKIFNVYSNNLDKVWYASSNIKYSECIDNENELKTLKVVFNNATQYQYDKIHVNDYLFFRDSASQGKALNQYIKSRGYEYKKLEDANLESIEGELNFRMENGVFVFYKSVEHKLNILDNKDNVLLEKDVTFTQESFDVMCDALRALGHELYIDVDYPIDDVNEGNKNKIIECNLPF